MNVKRLVLILIQLTFYSISDAQISYTLKPISYEHKILVKMNLDTQTEEFVLADLNDVYRLVLNNKTKLSFSADYEFISASIRFTPKFFPGNNDDN